MDQRLVYKNIWNQLERQLYNFFPDVNLTVIKEKTDEAYRRCMMSLEMINDKYLNPEGIPYFFIDHSGCWSLFLYYLSNSLKNLGGGVTAGKVYYLNKILHGIDWYYEVDLPAHFMVEHPVGSVLGRAVYGDYLYIYQGVTIGGNRSLSEGSVVYPTLGNYVVLFSNAKVLGNVHVGNNVIFSANSYVINENIPDYSIVFGSSPNITIKRDEEKIKKCMRGIWRLDEKGNG